VLSSDEEFLEVKILYTKPKYLFHVTLWKVINSLPFTRESYKGTSTGMPQLLVQIIIDCPYNKSSLYIFYRICNIKQVQEGAIGSELET